MINSDMFRINDVWVAVSLLTRLPAPEPDWQDDAPAARSAWAFPLAGLVVAVIAGCVSHLLLWAGLGAGIVAGLALAMMVMITGAMHEDGLADCADGFWGGWDKDRRLRIMKDSSIGTYGVMALGLVVGLRWMALAYLFGAGWVFGPLIAAAMTSRSAMTWVMHLLPHARDDGLAVQTGRPNQKVALAATVLSVVVCFALIGLGTFAVALVAILAAGLVAGTARRKIEGQTGDVLGATQQVTDVLVLCVLTLLI